MEHGTIMAPSTFCHHRGVFYHQWACVWKCNYMCHVSIS